ncbi:Beta-lactamase enzyme family protein [Actinopolyspora xinjiangensis]|uniref:Beta-lactamase enzyme family protein n=1 Tax=Actinopolyspora xinjiangensis TaxID=405564 RepID=A0A1H0WTV3_9ACTN|nr:serine hydrolase [Actinopolyspora xinjiangensis]SDP94121.1 Beta-lactamase enzyme family protein [Actinopolyspora xinjiangensis]
MASNLLRQRLEPEFVSDSSAWSSKTGTLLNLRHEVGVVEHADGRTFAVAALTEAHLATANQPEADAVMAWVARTLRDQLRRGLLRPVPLRQWCAHTGTTRCSGPG